MELVGTDFLISVVEVFFYLFSIRPEYRWLLVGGPGSGTSLHKDPNGISFRPIEKKKKR